MEALEEELTHAQCFLIGISQVMGTKENLRWGGGDGEALWEPLPHAGES